MATARRTSVICDNCGTECLLAGENIKDARERAQSIGWVVGRRVYPYGALVDWCDLCKLARER